MRIEFVQSGGLLGTIKGCVLDTSALIPEVTQELERLVRASGISTSGEYLSDSGRDLEQYEITIEDGKRKLSVIFDKMSIPLAAKPLIGFLKKHARPRTLD